MPTYLILARSREAVSALCRSLRVFGVREADIADSILWADAAVGSAPGVLPFEVFAQRIERAMGAEAFGDALRETIVLVDCVRPSLLDPMREGDTWEGTLAMLILAFPEIRWVFGVVRGGDKGFPTVEHSIASLLCEPRRDRLFDPTGLRNFVKGRAASRLVEKVQRSNPSEFVPLRGKRAAAIDEETSYALFHAYTAYRFGFKAEVVRSWALMKYLFSGKGNHGFSLLFEDVNLDFPDKPEDVHLSDLSDVERGRAKNCPRLGYGDVEYKEDSDLRVLVTIGNSATDSGRMEKNVRYLRVSKPDGSSFLLKPGGGMFDLWEKAGLFLRLNESSFPGQAQDFRWPTSIAEDSAGARHSAPGKLMLVAERLIHRADALRAIANTTEECIYGALLATEGLEVLRYQTPMLAFQALELKHEFEVKAEVSFLGVGHHFDVRSRIDELERETRVASHFFKRERRRVTQLDVLVSILNRLMLVFRESGMFDEEQDCLHRLRGYHRRLQFRVDPSPAGFLKNVVLGYAEFLIASLPRFVAAISGWALIIFLTFLFLFDSDTNLAERATLSALLGSTPHDDAVKAGLVAIGVSVFAAGLGIFHIGILIAYLYSAVARK